MFPGPFAIRIYTPHPFVDDCQLSALSGHVIGKVGQVIVIERRNTCRETISIGIGFFIGMPIGIVPDYLFYPASSLVQLRCITIIFGYYFIFRNNPAKIKIGNTDRISVFKLLFPISSGIYVVHYFSFTRRRAIY